MLEVIESRNGWPGGVLVEPIGLYDGMDRQEMCREFFCGLQPDGMQPQWIQDDTYRDVTPTEGET